MPSFATRLLQWMRARRCASLALLVFLVSAPVPAQPRESVQARVPVQASTVALPTLSDALGWKQPRYYSTIQTVDIDGDGQTEVLARWINGLNIYRFDNGTLIRHSRIPALNDNAGFYQPSWYSTIHAGVLNPRLGQSDIIAREIDGIHVFRYDRDKKTWRELGSPSVLRPFADRDSYGVDWTQAKYYSTIQLADVDGDGVAELVGRGPSGMQVWHWNESRQSWSPILAGGTLGDSDGFDKEPYYSSIHFIDIDHDGAAEMIARSPEGVNTYKWSNAGWVALNSNGPFNDDRDFVSNNRYKSVHASLDATGQAWLYGIVGGSGGGAIEIHRWDTNHWQKVRTIQLPGSGWKRDSQTSTLVAADIQGDATPEFLVRGPRGLYAFDVKGRSLPTYSQSFTDAEGWNLAEEYGTMMTATANITENGRSQRRSLIVGRGTNGLEVYKFTGQWADAASSNFPQFCSNFKTDNDVYCLTYKTLSTAAAGVVDLRSQYTLNTNTKNTFSGWATSIKAVIDPYPANGPSALIFEGVRTQLLTEMDYGETIESWFFNNDAVLSDNFNASSNLLTTATGDVNASTTTTVTSKWLEFAADIVSSLAGAIPGGGDLSLALKIFNDTYKATASSGGDVQQEVGQISTTLTNASAAYVAANSAEMTAYLSSYSKMKQIGTDAGTGGYDWANATLTAVAAAKLGGRHGMTINFLRELLPAKWEVYWCTGDDWPPGTMDCSSDYTEAKYNCTYGVDPIFKTFPYQNSYIYAGRSATVNWSLLDRLTGPVTPGVTTDNLNAIWYMMLLGGDLGWDLPQTRSEEFSDGHLPDPNLAYSKIEHGYTEKSASCAGNLSTHGIIGSSQTLGARLSVAQQNTAQISESAARQILPEIRLLKLEAAQLADDRETRIDLTSPLREAATLVERAKTPGQRGQLGQVSATTPTHLAELFIQRTQQLAPKLGQSQAQHLTTQAYCLISEMEGQSEPGQGCQGAALPQLP